MQAPPDTGAALSSRTSPWFPGAGLPILTPLTLPATVAEQASVQAYLIGTPVADAFTTASKILVNIAYPDVIAPDQLDDCAQGCSGPTP